MLSALIVPAALAAAGVILAFQPVSGHARGATTYECGYAAFGGGRRHVPLNFFLVAVLFLLFDVELLILLPMAAARFAGTGLLAMFIFFVLLSLGFW